MIPDGWQEMSSFPPRNKFGPLIYYPQFYGVEEATCIVYEHDEGEAIGLVRAKLDYENSRWIDLAWMPIPPYRAPAARE